MVLPPTWSLAVADVVRYAALRPWQPRLTLHAAPESLPKRIERLRAAWTGSRLADGTLCAKFNFAMLEAAIEHVGKKRPPGDPVLDALLNSGSSWRCRTTTSSTSLRST